MGRFVARLKKPVVDPVAEFQPTAGDRYEGPACFYDGFYYPVLNDEHSNEIGPHPDWPLVWVVDENDPHGGYLKHAAPEDVNHFHAHGLNPVEMVIE